ncbi:MAG: hypothetical protein WBO17_15000 [Sphingorhabdus sp.]
MFELISALVLLAAEPLPPANPLPPPEFNDAQVLATIDAAFVALEAGDGTALLRHAYPDGRVTAMGTLRDGSTGLRSSSFAEYAGRMKLGTGFVERVTNPVIEIDDDVAMVWAPFTISAEGKVVSCGTDHFDLLRQDGIWKIMNLTFSSRLTGCSGQ